MLPRPIRLAALVAALSVALPVSAAAQAPEQPWYARVWSVDGATMLAVRADTGQEVRAGRRGPRHGIRVPLIVDDASSVHFDIEAGGERASRWVLRREGGVVHIEEWIRNGPAGTPFRLVREVARPASG